MEELKKYDLSKIVDLIKKIFQIEMKRLKIEESFNNFNKKVKK